MNLPEGNDPNEIIDLPPPDGSTENNGADKWDEGSSLEDNGENIEIDTSPLSNEQGGSLFDGGVVDSQENGQNFENPALNYDDDYYGADGNGNGPLGLLLFLLVVLGVVMFKRSKTDAGSEDKRKEYRPIPVDNGYGKGGGGTMYNKGF
mmetsp:Transcript_16061/g.22382  ORF Transcript_16061/g.22382 Transcript_16061/m.22382 type:complete len:149 (+) Transcript_16061:309-755(+)